MLSNLSKFIDNNIELIIEYFAVGLVIFTGFIVLSNNAFSLEFYNNTDVQRGFHRGLDVLHGVNSYLDFNPNNMLTQEKVPGFFPLYFLFMAFVTKLSSSSFVLFIDNLRIIIFFCYSALGVLVYLKLRPLNKVLAILGMALFMFNRWTLADVIYLKQESYVLLLLLISLMLLNKNKYLSYFLYGVATAIKHLSLLLLPIYLINIVFNNEKTIKQKVQHIALSLMLMSIPIVIPSIPYLIDSPSHFINSIAFNVTRESESDINAKLGFDKLLVLYNQDRVNPLLLVLPRLPMLIMFGLLIYIFYIGKINLWLYALLAYGIFIGLNPTLYTQYYVWFMLFFSLSLDELAYKYSINNNNKNEVPRETEEKKR